MFKSISHHVVIIAWAPKQKTLFKNNNYNRTYPSRSGTHDLFAPENGNGAHC